MLNFPGMVKHSLSQWNRLMRNALPAIVLSMSALSAYGQKEPARELITAADLEFLEGLTKEVVEASRILPGQKVSPGFGGNRTGGILIRPGGRDCYPAFWIRDYAMSLESGFIKPEEQEHMLRLTASVQCDQTWITEAGSMIPAGSIADHIRIDDGNPVYFPGTYDYMGQGGEKFGRFPPYCDQYFFIHMACYLAKSTGNYGILKETIRGTPLTERLEQAFRVPPSRLDGVLVFTTDDYRGVDFGFRDVIHITGDLCLPSILKYKASQEMALIFKMVGDTAKSSDYEAIAIRLKKEIPRVFSDRRGMLLASTGKSRQADVWSTALAVEYGLLEGPHLEKTCTFLADAYRNGWLSSRGNIRHILTCDDFSASTAWEGSLAKKNSYQNGAWWGTPTGWVCKAIARVDLEAARKLAKEYIEDLRAGDFRKGPEYGAPWECYNESSPQNAVYMTTVTAPFIVFSNR